MSLSVSVIARLSLSESDLSPHTHSFPLPKSLPQQLFTRNRQQTDLVCTGLLGKQAPLRSACSGNGRIAPCLLIPMLPASHPCVFYLTSISHHLPASPPARPRSDPLSLRETNPLDARARAPGGGRACTAGPPRWPARHRAAEPPPPSRCLPAALQTGGLQPASRADQGTLFCGPLTRAATRHWCFSAFLRVRRADIPGGGRAALGPDQELKALLAAGKAMVAPRVVAAAGRDHGKEAGDGRQWRERGNGDTQAGGRACTRSHARSRAHARTLARTDAARTHWCLARQRRARPAPPPAESGRLASAAVDKNGQKCQGRDDSDQDLVARLAGCGEACMQPIHLRGGGASLRRRGHRIGRARARQRTAG